MDPSFVRRDNVTLAVIGSSPTNLSIGAFALGPKNRAVCELHWKNMSDLEVDVTYK